MAPIPSSNLNRRNKSPVNICSFNSRSIRNKIPEISHFLSANRIQILAVSETWLGPTISDTAIKIPNFQPPLRKDRCELGGGVCIYVSNQLPCRRREDLEMEGIEVIWIEVFGVFKRPVLIGCCYRPPSSDRSFYDLLEKIIEKVINKNVLLLGDFNAKNNDWYSGDCTNANGVLLKDVVDNYCFTQLCNEPTHLGKNGRPESLLDLAITNRPEHFRKVGVLPPLSTSDHLPIVMESVFEVDDNFHGRIAPGSRWLFHLKDGAAMLHAFRGPSWGKISGTKDINNMWRCWKETFFQEIDSFIPSEQIKTSVRKRPPWLSVQLRRQINKKNSLYKRALKNGSTDSWELYRTFRNKITAAIKAAKYVHLTRKVSLLADPECPSRTWWKTVKDLCGHTSPASDSTVPPLKVPNNGSDDYVTEDEGKANLFNDVFINQNKTLNESSFPFGPTQISTTFSMEGVSLAEVSRELRNLPNKQSSGTDGISYRLLREAGPGLAMPLTTLFNRSIALGKAPEEWTTAIITPIFKGGRKDSRLPVNYRPIALTSCVARVLEKIINKRLLRYLTENHLIYKHQSGFLPDHSTVTQLCLLLHRWKMALDRREVVQAAFLDLSKAYDRVSIPALLYKLSSTGVSKQTLEWFSSFLSARTQCVQVNGRRSDWKSVKSGIPQGTVLGPTLFLVFINDLPSVLDTDCSIFADDTSTYTIGKSLEDTAKRLSLGLESADRWAFMWGMLFNAEKSVHLTMGGSGTCSPVSMNGIELPKNASHRHLGLTINGSLTWKDHIQAVYSACARQLGMLRRLRGKVTCATAVKIFKGFIQPRLEYASALWSGGNTRKLSRLQERFCRDHNVHLPPLARRFEYHTLILFFKIRQKLSPSYLNEILPETFSQTTPYNLRKSVYPVPMLTKKSTYSDFFPRSIILWNGLPIQVQQSCSLSTFKVKIRSHLHL